MMACGKYFQYTPKLAFIKVSISVIFNKSLFYSLASSTSTLIEMAVSFRLVISDSVRSLTIQMISRYNMGPGEHRIFRRKNLTKNCFDEVEIRQNDNSTKSFFDEIVQ